MWHKPSESESDDDLAWLDQNMADRRAEQAEADADCGECGPKCSCLACCGMSRAVAALQSQVAAEDAATVMRAVFGGDSSSSDSDDEAAQQLQQAEVHLRVAAEQIVWSDDDTVATDQAKAFLRAHMWGQLQLVLATLEYADDHPGSLPLGM